MEEKIKMLIWKKSTVCWPVWKYMDKLKKLWKEVKKWTNYIVTQDAQPVKRL